MNVVGRPSAGILSLLSLLVWLLLLVVVVVAVVVVVVVIIWSSWLVCFSDPLFLIPLWGTVRLLNDQCCPCYVKTSVFCLSGVVCDNTCLFVWIIRKGELCNHTIMCLLEIIIVYLYELYNDTVVRIRLRERCAADMTNRPDSQREYWQ